MPFSLFECKDGTFVVVPRGLAPPLPAYQAHGESIHLSDLCRHLYETSVWDDVSREVDRQLYAVVHPDVAFHLFDMPAGTFEAGAGESDGGAPAASLRVAAAGERRLCGRQGPGASGGVRVPGSSGRDDTRKACASESG